ncbi:MAG: class I lanthipeptide [Thermoanaerobaculia bacterium]
MKKKTNQKKLTLHRESLVQLREPNLELVAGGYSLRCDTTYYASCVSCAATVCSAKC